MVVSRGQLDLRVSVRGGVHFDLVKRVLRDINRSGQAPEEIIQQISDTVYPMYKVRPPPTPTPTPTPRLLSN